MKIFIVLIGILINEIQQTLHKNKQTNFFVSEKSVLDIHN